MTALLTALALSIGALVGLLMVVAGVKLARTRGSSAGAPTSYEAEPEVLDLLDRAKRITDAGATFVSKVVRDTDDPNISIATTATARSLDRERSSLLGTEKRRGVHREAQPPTNQGRTQGRSVVPMVLLTLGLRR